MSSLRKKTNMTQLSDFQSLPVKRVGDDGGAEIIKEIEEDKGEGESNLTKLLESEVESIGQRWNVKDFKEIVTAKNLCSCKNPIDMAFKVNCTLRKLADICTENTEFLKKLADQTEDFAVQLIDQVNANEELVFPNAPENVDQHASLLRGMTEDAIVNSQKKFVSHPLLYRRLDVRWNLGLPDVFKRHRFLLFLFILIDAFLTPFLLPIVAFAFHVDQKKCRIRSLKVKSQRQSEIFPLHTEKSQKNALGIYYAFFTTPFVKFVKDKLSQLIFIVLHCRICTLPSAVGPMIEEYLIFVFFCGMILSEYQQYKTSPLKYFKDMWNYLDVITLIVYILILILRMVTIARGGDPYHNRLLEVVNYLYGVNTLFLILRFSSILERSSLVGPLQLALFRMCVDLFIILIQFCFVICAFSVAITKSYIAEVSYHIPSHTDQSAEIATKGEHHSLIKTSGQLIWSLFGLTSLQDLEADTRETTDVVLVLFCIFLILSVVMLVNMLVALLTTTYDQASSNAEVEWKFARAVIENQYRGLHPVVVPFNLLSVPGTYFLLGGKEDARKAEAKDVKESCKSYYQERLFPVITERYEKKYGGSFPLSVEEKIDVLMDKLKVLSSAEIVPEDHAEELGATCTGKLAADGKSTGAPLAETEDLESTTPSPPPSTNVVRISCAQ